MELRARYEVYEHEMELESGVLVFEEEGKPENPEKIPRSKEENQQQAQPTNERPVRESNPGHIGWRRALSPLRHPCAPPPPPKKNRINDVILRQQRY